MPGPDGVAGKWPFDADSAWIVTAHNPRSMLLSPEVNAERHAALGADIGGLGFAVLPNVGFDPDDPTWREDGYTILGADEGTVLGLARKWEQNAVFGWWPDRLEVIGVLIAGRTVRGWTWGPEGRELEESHA